MSLLKMSFSGALLILVIVILRALFVNKLPKKTFMVLWGIVLLRLMVPFSVPSPVSAYSLMEQDKNITASEMEAADESNENRISRLIPVELSQPIVTGNEGISHTEGGMELSIGLLIWGIGACGLGVFFTVSYLRCKREFKMSLPVANAYAAKWLKEHPLKRTLEIRQSDRISAPLTYGFFHPVILMPQKTDWEDQKGLQYVLLHEYVHIRRFDGVLKLIGTAALCIHWFNPMVWIMYILFNRDMELSCDETVIRKFGEEAKSSYACMLISMEEKKSGLIPLCSNFSKNAIEERVTAIMKIKKTSLFAGLFAIALIVSVALVFATSAKSASLKDSLTTIPGNDFTEEIAKLEEQLSSDKLQIQVEYSFQPLSAESVEDSKLHDRINAEISAQWEETLEPYVPFGLVYSITPHYDGSEISMYYQGQEVRGIVDETRNLWITEHTGISAYSPDAVELYAVYKDGKLSGLRTATEEEIAEWDSLRSQNQLYATESGHK